MTKRRMSMDPEHMPPQLLHPRAAKLEVTGALIRSFHEQGRQLRPVLRSASDGDAFECYDPCPGTALTDRLQALILR